MRDSHLTTLLAVLVGASVAGFTQAQPEPAQRPTTKTFHRTLTVEERLDYLLFLPANYDPGRTEGWPLMLFLHGAGERGADLSLAKKHGPPKRAEADAHFPFVLVCPQCPEGRVWRNSELIGLLDSVAAAHNIDTNRIYLTGLSMGGYGTWSLGLAEPGRFAAIAPICGGGERIAVVLAGRTQREAILRLPVWAFHGAKDPVVPVEESERMVQMLKGMGAEQVRLTIYPDAEHDSWTRTYDNPEFCEWLLPQRRLP